MKLYLCETVPFIFNDDPTPRYVAPVSGSAMYSADYTHCIVLTDEPCNGAELNGENAEAEAIAATIWAHHGVLIG